MFLCANMNLLLLMMIFLPYLAVHGTKIQPPEHIVLYAHESRVSPSNTLIVSALPSGNSTTGDDHKDSFGLIRTVSNVLKEGEAKDSAIVGSQVGIVVIGKDGANVYISFTYFLNANATYKGTIAVHGHIDGTSTVERAFAVVGGTGDFLSVSGVDKSIEEPRRPADPADVVNIHHLTLSYPALHNK